MNHHTMLQINRHKTLVGALDTAWTTIQRRHPDVPGVVLTLGPDTLAAGNDGPGHFAACRWQHTEAWTPELIISADGLRHRPLEVMATLLHEAAHGLAFTRQINDTSRQGRYHNARYRTHAVEVGLAAAETAASGWSVTTLPPGTADRYRAEMTAIAEALAAFERPQTRRAATQKNKNGTIARCRCGRQFRITVAVLDLAPIICGRCGESFIAEPSPAQHDET